jgi:nucleoside-triphosphatase THEP1
LTDREKAEVVIVTGARDCGKTTWCRDNLCSETTGGVLLAKAFHHGEFIGYDAVRIGGQERAPFMRVRSFDAPGWDPDDEIGQFRISTSGQKKASEWIRLASQDPSRDVLVDEVGRLELAGRGYFPVLRSVLNRSRRGRLYLVVRETHIQDTMKLLGIEEADIIRIAGGKARSRSHHP